MSTEATKEPQVVDADKLEDGSHDISAWPRQAAGMIGGLALALLVYYFFPASAVDLVSAVAKDPEAEYSYEAMRITAATAVLMGAWWMTEAIPLAATALVPLVVFPVLQVVKFDDIATPYASPTIFLFMSGFILALTMQKWNLHRRLALLVVLAVGTKPKQLIGGFMLATGFLSMWVSNTATAVVMLPIGLSVLALTAGIVGGHDKQRNFATALMLAIAYAASIGSLGTIIGTPPNALLVAYLSENHDVHIGFGQWMLVGTPLAIVYMIEQTGALGSAVFAAVAAGLYPDVFAAAEAMSSVEKHAYVPNLEASARYDELYAIYKELHDFFGRYNGVSPMHRLKEIRARIYRDRDTDQ